MAGLFISFEGGEGCGKSTQIGLLSERLKSEGRIAVQTREPGGTPLGEAVRNLLQHDEAGEGMHSLAELMLFAASRTQHVHEKIRPAIERGETVLCDRFMDSTTAYQGAARKLDPDTVSTINEIAIDSVRPDLTILIDLSPQVGMQRVRARGNGELDRMEQEAIEFFEAVRAGYLKLAASEPERFLVLDGSESVETLQAQIWNAVMDRL
ncbi:MAG: dTMP kinase [Opitutaceae bacterium]